MTPDDAWQKKCAKRQHPAQFDMQLLINLLLPYVWMHECNIFQNAQGRWVVKWGDSYLRHSAGPLQGTFWDNYGDDFHSPELALVALSKSAPPPRVDYVIPTHGT